MLIVNTPSIDYYIIRGKWHECKSNLTRIKFLSTVNNIKYAIDTLDYI